MICIPPFADKTPGKAENHRLADKNRKDFALLHQVITGMFLNRFISSVLEHDIRFTSPISSFLPKVKE